MNQQKKYLCIIVAVLCMLISLVGCGNQTNGQNLKFKSSSVNDSSMIVDEVKAVTFSTAEEWNSYIEQYKENAGSGYLVSSDADIWWSNLAPTFDKYDAAYFEEKDLILVYVPTTSGTNVKVKRLTYDKETETGEILLKSHLPRGGYEHFMELWYLLIEPDEKNMITSDSKWEVTVKE